MSGAGRTLKLYLMDGSPLGVITAELGVSSIRAVASPRTALKELIGCPEAKWTGIYLLLGPDPDAVEGMRVYVGEADAVHERIKKHDGDEAKEFFTRLVFVVSKDNNLTKAHVRYLESRLIAAVKQAGRAKLDNGTAPPVKGLPEPEVADMEQVFREIEVLLPVLGFDVLRPAGKGVGVAPAKAVQSVNGTALPVEGNPIFRFSVSGTEATGREANGDFVVFSGSRASKSESSGCSPWIKRSRDALIKDGRLLPAGDKSFLEFKVDVPFASPWAAAAAVYGSNVSETKYWKDIATGKSYAEWRKEQLADGSSAPTTTPA